MLHALTTAFYIALTAALCGNGIALMTKSSDELLGWIPERWNKIINFPQNPKRALLAKLPVCPKCLSGQIALWTWLILPNGHNISFLFVCVLSAVTFARITEKFT